MEKFGYDFKVSLGHRCVASSKEHLPMPRPKGRCVYFIPALISVCLINVHIKIT